MKTNVTHLLEDTPRLSVGILTADLLNLGHELEALDRAGIELVHIDVMDGVFCPQLTVGPPLVRAIPDRFIKDVHLMVHEPLGKIDPFIDAGAGIITIHAEATRHPHRVLQSLAGTGVIRGIALNPGTPLTAVEPLLDELDLLLILAVNPGWAGQGFIATAERRLAEARQLTDGRQIILALDGGISKENAEQLASLDLDLFVSGSAIYDSTDPAENARFMQLAAARPASQPPKRPTETNANH